MTISTAVDPNARASVVGIDENFVDLRAGAAVGLPQRIAVYAQGATAATYSLDKREVLSDVEAGTVYGFGSPAHLAVQQMKPQNGDGVGIVPVTVYPMDDAGGALAAIGDITPSAGPQTAAGSYRVNVNNILSEAFIIPVGAITVATIVADATAAINANLDMPVVATDNTTDVILTSKWKGDSANDLIVSVVGPALGTLFAITQPTGGATNPNVDTPLALVGDIWETLALNCLDIADTATLDKFEAFGATRYDALVHQEINVYTGNTAATVSGATAVSDARKLDRVNGQLVSPGTADLPFVVAARQLARVASVGNNNAPVNYNGQRATGLTPGADNVQWDYAERQAAFTAGSSTIVKRDGVVELEDIRTFYHPDGDPNPAYAWQVDNCKRMNYIYNVNAEFSQAAWRGAPLVPDSQAVVNPAARQPKDAVTAMSAIADGAAAEAWISDPEFAKANTVAGIDSGNPKRLNVAQTIKLAGNSNIISITENWGFFFGGN